MSEQGVYRETVDRIGGNEREEEAVRVFGLWRDRIKSRALALFGVLGLIPGALAYYFSLEWQFTHNNGVASVKASAGIAGAVWFLFFLIGAFVGRTLVRSRTPAKLDELAKAYEIPVAGLHEIASMVDKL
jgi:hypothetical protein